MLLPSMPSSSSSRQGQMPKRSAFGQGMCQNVRTVARGSRSRIMRGSEREVVVLHQDDRIVGVDLLAHRVGEPLVDGLVVLPVLAAEDRARVGDVAERPEPLVGEAVVVALLLLGVSQTRRSRYDSSPGRHAHAAVRVDGLAVGRAAAVGDPDAGAGAHDRLERGDQAARRVQHADAAVGGALVDVGLAVGDDDDLLALQVAAEGLLEPLRASRRPPSPSASLLGDEPLDQLAHVAQDGLELRALAARPRSSRAARRSSCARTSRAATSVTTAAASARKPKASSRKRPGRRLPALDEAQVVDQHHEAQRLSPSSDRDGADVHARRRAASTRRPRVQAAAGESAVRTHVRPQSSARELARVVARCARAASSVGGARGGAP